MAFNDKTKLSFLIKTYDFINKKKVLNDASQCVYKSI